MNWSKHFFVISYNGSGFHGWQNQKDGNSVQEVIEKILTSILKKTMIIYGCGRTDAGVHAIQMFAHFDTEKKLTENDVRKFNSILPNDIIIKSLKMVLDTTHA